MKTLIPILIKVLKALLPLLTGAAGGALTGCTLGTSNFYNLF